MLIAAEIGVNWTCLDHATKMMQQAKNAGADAVKFQVYSEEQLSEVREKDPLTLKRLVEIMLTRDYIQTLKDRADDIGIEFFATPMFPEAVGWLEAVDVKRYKVRYDDRSNIPLLDRINKTNKPFYLSTRNPLDTPHHLDYDERIHLVYCIRKYPSSLEDMKDFPGDFGNYIDRYWKAFEGYSNHYPGMAPALLAVARGVEYVEIHVMDDNWKMCFGEPEPIDKAVSWTFDQFREFVKLAREMETIR